MLREGGHTVRGSRSQSGSTGAETGTTVRTVTVSTLSGIKDARNRAQTAFTDVVDLRDHDRDQSWCDTGAKPTFLGPRDTRTHSDGYTRVHPVPGCGSSGPCEGLRDTHTEVQPGSTDTWVPVLDGTRQTLEIRRGLRVEVGDLRRGTGLFLRRRFSL